jgi:multicomponent Na+:H+ antiporter subunit G
MSPILAFALILYVAGLFFNLTAIIGIIRLPDVYCRLHSSAKNATLGSLFILVGLALRALQAGDAVLSLKLLLIGALLMVVSPVGSDALAQAAYVHDAPFVAGTVCDQYADCQEHPLTREDLDDVTG